MRSEQTASDDSQMAAEEVQANPSTEIVNWRDISWQGLWKNNPALVQLLGLCPLLAVTNTVTNAMGLGLATLLVLVVSNLTIASVKQWVTKEIRIPVFIMIIASFVTLLNF